MEIPETVLPPPPKKTTLSCDSVIIHMYIVTSFPNLNPLSLARYPLISLFYLASSFTTVGHSEDHFILQKMGGRSFGWYLFSGVRQHTLCSTTIRR